MNSDNPDFSAIAIIGGKVPLIQPKPQVLQTPKKHKTGPFKPMAPTVKVKQKPKYRYTEKQY